MLMRYLLIIIFILPICYLTIQRAKHPQLNFNSVSDRLTHPFDSRLRFKIAEVDSRFGLTQQQVIQLSEEAIQIWHQGTGREYFVYDPNAQLSIRLIYDDRQENFNAMKQTEKKLTEQLQHTERDSENISSAQQNLDHLQNSIKQRRYQLDYEFEQLQKEQNALREQHNASTESQQQLIQKRWRLEEQKNQLQQDIDYFNRKSQGLNSQVHLHNKNADQLREDAMQALRRFPPREFHKGIFMGDQIQIYQFDTEDDLRLTLAHELGHALGIEHHADPQALMYPMLEQQDLKNFRLKSADIDLLNRR
jgi:multidrug efflux pump subunit AcrB